jgi:hypothetical protein
MFNLKIRFGLWKLNRTRRALERNYAELVVRDLQPELQAKTKELLFLISRLMMEAELSLAQAGYSEGYRQSLSKAQSEAEREYSDKFQEIDTFMADVQQNLKKAPHDQRN